MSQKKVLSKNETKMLIENAPDIQTRMIIKTMVNTGFRVSELINFKISWILFEDNIIRIKENKEPIKFSPKYKSIREIPISSMFCLELKQFVRKRRRGYVFRSQRKKYPQRYTKQAIIGKINSISKKIFNGTVGSHILRRTYASNLLYGNINIKKIQELLGHKNLRTTFIYLQDIPHRGDYNEIRKIQFY